MNLAAAMLIANEALQKMDEERTQFEIAAITLTEERDALKLAKLELEEDGKVLREVLKKGDTRLLAQSNTIREYQEDNQNLRKKVAHQYESLKEYKVLEHKLRTSITQLKDSQETSKSQELESQVKCLENELAAYKAKLESVEREAKVITFTEEEIGEMLRNLPDEVFQRVIHSVTLPTVAISFEKIPF